MKRKYTNLFLVLVIVFATGVVPAKATPKRTQISSGSITGTGASDLKQTIDDFAAKADHPVGADEIVTFLDGSADTAAQSDYPFGPVAIFNPAATYMHIAAAKLTDSKFILVYRDVGNAGKGTAIVGQVSGTSISYGAEVVFNSGSTLWESVTALSETKFVVAYVDVSDFGSGKTQVGKVTGTTISFGPKNAFPSFNTQYATVTALSDTAFIVAFRDVEFGHGMARVGQVTGMNISYGSYFTFNSEDTEYISVDAFSDTKFVIAYQDVGNAWYGTAIVGQVTGTSISYGSEFVLNSAMTQFTSVSALTDNKFVVAYQDLGNGGYGTAIVGEVTDTSISCGSEAVFNAANTFLYHSGGVSQLSNTAFVVGYENVSDSDGRVVTGSVLGSDISFGNQVSYNAGSSVYDVTVVALSASQYVVAWDDESNSDYGTARVGTIATFGPPTVFNTSFTYNHIAATKLTDRKFVVAYLPLVMKN